MANKVVVVSCGKCSEYSRNQMILLFEIWDGVTFTKAWLRDIADELGFSNFQITDSTVMAEETVFIWQTDDDDSPIKAEVVVYRKNVDLAASLKSPLNS